MSETGTVRASEDLIGALRPGLRGAWERFWFGEGSLVRLGAFRIAVLSVGLYALTFFRPGLVQDDASLELVQRKFTPVYFLDVLGIGPQSPELAATLYWVIAAVLVLGIVGLFTRAMCVLAAVGMLYWMGTAYSWGKPHHEYGSLAFALCALPLGPVGARLSIDSVVRRWSRAKGGRGSVPAPPERAEGALVPIRLTQLTLAGGYLFAAASKLAIGGVDWLNGYTLQAILLEFEEPMSRWVAEQLPLVLVLSWSVIAIQLGSVWSVLWRPARWLFVPLVISMHLGSRQTMDTGTFFGLWGLQAAFVDFERVPGFLGRLVHGGGELRRWSAGLACAALALGLVAIYLEKAPTWTLVGIVPLLLAGGIGWWVRGRTSFVFDGGCGLCRRTVVVLSALDWSNRVRFLPTTDWDAVTAAHAELDRDACIADIHAVDAHGRVRVGYAAYCHVARRLPLLLPLAAVMPVPPVSTLGRRIYRFVADRRHTTSCSLAPDPSAEG